MLIPGAIEGSHRSLSETAGGLGGAGKQAQRGRTIGAAALFKNFLPPIFRIPKDRSHKLAGAICRRAARSRLLLLRWWSSLRENLGATDQEAGIDPQCPADQAKDDDRAKSQPAGPARSEAAASPDVLDVLAPPEIIPAHGRLRCCRSGSLRRWRPFNPPGQN